MDQTDSDNSYSRKPDEISIKSLIISIKDYFFLILRNWYFILIGQLLFAAYQYYSVAKIKPTFPAKVVLMVRSQDVASENQQMIKIYSRLINSRNLLEELFLQPIDDSKPDHILINEYLNTFYKHKPEQLNDDVPEGFQFSNTKLRELNLEEKKVFKIIIDKVITPMSDFTDGFVSISTDESVGFITINVSSPTEGLSLLLLDKICLKAEQLLFNNTIFAPKLAFKKLEQETDSLSKAFEGLYFKWKSQKGLYEKTLREDPFNKNRLAALENRTNQLEAASEVFRNRYLTSLEQLKAAQVDMDQKTLLVQQIERTYAPIEPFKPSAKRAVVKGGILGTGIVIFVIILIRIYFNIIREL